MLIDIRDAFFEQLYKKIKKDKKIILLSVDQGALTINKIIRDFPNNYINIGISEQNAFNIATGLAKRNYKPYVYLISPFTLRAAEQIKIGLCSMKQKVSIVASGPGFTYASDGPTHYFNEDYGVLKNFPNLNFFCTSDPHSAKRAFLKSYQSKNPSFIRLEKGKHKTLKKYSNSSLNYISSSNNVLVISNGYTSILAKKILDTATQKHKFALLDITQFIPLEKKTISKIILKYKKIIFLDESPFISSINKDIHYICLNNQKLKNLKFFFYNTDFKFWKVSGNRDYLLKLNSLDEINLKKNIINIIKYK
tara:strand:+ start:138 stop:1061 length:924 start_codon:yes stop_codon:yes gene_type:complete